MNPEKLSKAYELLVKEGLVFYDNKLWGNPGGILFTEEGFKVVFGVEVDNLTTDDTIQLGSYHIRGDIFAKLIKFYSTIDGVTSCMDPRVLGTNDLVKHGTHHHCGAGNLVATSTSLVRGNGQKIESKYYVGEQLERALANLDKVKYLGVVKGTENGHQDSGIVISFVVGVGVADGFRKKMVKDGSGGAYLTTFGLRELDSYMSDQQMNDNEKTEFIKQLVAVNVGIAFDIATQHNLLKLSEIGFNIVFVEDDKQQDYSSLKKQIKGYVDELIKTKLSNISVTTITTYW